MSEQYVYPFSAGSREQVDLLGGKGANLAEMTQLGLPVPPGFTITTDTCRYYMRYGHEPSVLADQVKRELGAVEATLGRIFGDPKNPLLVSVRSGAKVSMPGMMETVLNVGLNDETLEGARGALAFAAVRARFLPQAPPNVWPHRARYRCRTVRGGSRRR